MTDETPDSEMVENVRNGNADAFAVLVARHQDRVYNLAYRMTGNHTDAAEMAQDAFVKAYEKIDTYNAEYPFGNWVMGICANQSRNLFRSRTRRQNAEQQHVDYWEAKESTPSHGSRMAELSDALMQLPEKMRVAVTLKHIEGCSYEELGALLRVGVSAAKMRVKRGLEQLAVIMTTTQGEGDQL